MEFHQSDAFVRGLMGPVGSGKSSACCVEILTRSLQQDPGPDGVRRSRWAAIRNSYGELKTTTLKTWQDWFAGMETTRYDAPIVSTISLPDLGDGTSLHLEVLFIALDRPEDAGKLRSLELTGAWLNEASELEKTVLDMATQRVGRYPSLRVGGPSWTGVIMDTNPPDDESWWYDLAENKKPESFEFFRQAGGLYRVMDKKSADYLKYKNNPDAENISNLKAGYQYYHQQLDGKTDDYIKVFIFGEYGTTLHGKPVYPEFNEKIHISPTPLKAVHGIPIVLSFDFGLTPAAIFSQMTPRGQMVVLKELVSEDSGISQFYSEAVLPVINHEYGGFRIEAVGDPAGVGRSQADEKTCFEALAALGCYCEPAGTSNRFLERREAVAYFLNRNTSAGPGMLIDPSCKTIIKGFRGGYRYERLKVSGSALFKDKPAKDRYSHPHDALQYGCVHLKGDHSPVAARPVVQIAWA
jgi:hypothetical protein